MRRPISEAERAEIAEARLPISDRSGGHAFDAAVRKAELLVRSSEQDAAPADATTLLGLHAVFHRECYGALPDDLRGKSFFAALANAKSLLAREFPGETGLADAASYLAWAWQREIARERRRRAEQDEAGGRRLSWQLVFGRGGHVLGDWRAALERRRGSRRAEA